MVIRCGGTMNIIANMSMNCRPTTMPYRYAAFDGFPRLVSREIETLV